MAYHNVWEFKSGDSVFDKIHKCSAKVLVLNSNTPQIERRFYIQTLSDNLFVYEWRTADQLERA